MSVLHDDTLVNASNFTNSFVFVAEGYEHLLQRNMSRDSERTISAPLASSDTRPLVPNGAVVDTSPISEREGISVVDDRESCPSDSHIVQADGNDNKGTVPVRGTGCATRKRKAVERDYLLKPRRSSRLSKQSRRKQPLRKSARLQAIIPDRVKARQN